MSQLVGNCKACCKRVPIRILERYTYGGVSESTLKSKHTCSLFLPSSCFLDDGLPDKIMESKYEKLAKNSDRHLSINIQVLGNKNVPSARSGPSRQIGH